jgi:CRP/FNR family transcriptional regulator, cyclic AMP receptor protein
MKTRSIPEIMAELATFEGLDPQWQDTIAGCGRLRAFDAGAMLLQSGATAEEFHVIREGSVAIEITAPGRPPLVIETLGPGELVGASWLFPPYQWTFDARARTATRTLGFDATCLRRKCDTDPTLGYTLMRRFAATFHHRLQAARLQLLDLYGSGDD